jgi:hypothetical protein
MWILGIQIGCHWFLLLLHISPYIIIFETHSVQNNIFSWYSIIK